MNSIDGLLIYKQMMGLLYYTEMIVKKYPKSEKLSLVSQIKNVSYNTMRLIIKAYKESDKTNRYHLFNEIDAELKMIKVLSRISYSQRFINVRNYEAWARKITDVTNLLYGWMKNGKNCSQPI
ncbi:MAG: four helix bundle protein [bacterium]|nr:four helix bundle protein [bacterium]